MGPTWGRQDPGGPHVGYMKIAIWEITFIHTFCETGLSDYVNVTVYFGWLVINGSCNGLVSPENKHLPESTLTKPFVAWRYMATMC